jgi:hypothetical protein
MYAHTCLCVHKYFLEIDQSGQLWKLEAKGRKEGMAFFYSCVFLYGLMYLSRTIIGLINTIGKTLQNIRGMSSFPNHFKN